MTTHRKLEWAIFIVSFGGLLFSGYLSATKFFTSTCAFGETCPVFLGYPACYFGFAMYLIITLFAGLHVAHRYDGMRANRIILTVSLLGVLFSGYFTLLEIGTLFTDGITAYVLGLPTCALGLIFYLLLASLSLRLRKDFNTIA